MTRVNKTVGWLLSGQPTDYLAKNVDDVRFVQPVGFVWFRKPRYRIKATSRKAEA